MNVAKHKFFIGLLPFLLASAACAADSAQIIAAKTVFKDFKALSDNFDVRVAELYAKDAVIQNTRYYSTGQTKTIKLSGEQYKHMLIATMPMARAQADKDTYTKESYKQEGERVRVTAMRHSGLKNYDSWFVILLEKRGNDWLIVQEQSQSRP